MLYVAHLSSDAELREEPLIRQLIEAEPQVAFFACDEAASGAPEAPLDYKPFLPVAAWPTFATRALGSAAKRAPDDEQVSAEVRETAARLCSKFTPYPELA